MDDSGKRHQFGTGAVRDTAENKSRPDLISPFSLMRLGDWLRKGAEKYDERNWEKGMGIGRCIAAITRHLLSYGMGMRNEDHMAAVMCNAMFIMHYEEMITRGVLPADLKDMPDYSRRIPLLTAPKLDGARMYIESETMDADYGLELADQNRDVIGLNPILKDTSTYEPISKVTGQCMSKNLSVTESIKKIQAAFRLPDDNLCTSDKCDICGTKEDVKYYRSDLKRSYCTLCYINNRIDLKPVIIWS